MNKITFNAMQKIYNSIYQAKFDKRSFINKNSRSLQEVQKVPKYLHDGKKLYAVVDFRTLENILSSFHVAQEKNFNNYLEKTIWQAMPIDFNDAWTVVLDKIKSLNDKTENLDLTHIVQSVKKEHPNLFVDVEDFVLKLKDRHD